MCTTVIAIDVTAKAIFERLYLVSGRRTFVLSINCPCGSTPPTAHFVANSWFFCLFVQNFHPRGPTFFWSARFAKWCGQVLVPSSRYPGQAREVLKELTGCGQCSNLVEKKFWHNFFLKRTIQGIINVGMFYASRGLEYGDRHPCAKIIMGLHFFVRRILQRPVRRPSWFCPKEHPWTFPNSRPTWKFPSILDMLDFRQFSWMVPWCPWTWIGASNTRVFLATIYIYIYIYIYI